MLSDRGCCPVERPLGIRSRCRCAFSQDVVTGDDPLTYSTDELVSSVEDFYVHHDTRYSRRFCFPLGELRENVRVRFGREFRRL